MSLSHFECLSKEILHEIADILGSDTFLGPPTDVRSLRLLSRTVYHTVSWHSVFAKVFREKFDVLAPVRRLGRVCEHPDVLTEELAIRFETLKRFRTAYYVEDGHIHIGVGTVETLRRDLWKGFLMFTENEGKNARQLIEYARIDVFARRYISRHGPLLRTAAVNRGWIFDDEYNSLALALFAYTDRGRVPRETGDELRAVVRALTQPFADSAVYSSTLEPITTATNPLVTSYSNYLTLLSRLLHQICIVPKHFGRELRLARPSITESVSMCISSRLDRLKLERAMDIFSRGRLSSAAIAHLFAVSGEVSGAQLVAWDEVSSAPGPMESRCSDHDWARMYNTYYPQSPSAVQSRVLTLGALHGKWKGYNYETTYDYTAPFDRWGRPTLAICNRKFRQTAMEFEIREYHQHTKSAVFPFNDMNYGPNGVEGVLDAWFPPMTTLTQVLDALVVSTRYPRRIASLYEGYNPTAAPSHNDLARDPEAPYGEGVWDIILLGRVPESSSAAAGPYQYFGRVRSWDGLAVILHGDSTVDIRRKRIFYGYLRGNKNIVGRWRDRATPLVAGERGLTGAWIMTKCS